MIIYGFGKVASKIAIFQITKIYQIKNFQQYFDQKIDVIDINKKILAKQKQFFNYEIKLNHLRIELITQVNSKRGLTSI